MSPDATPPHNTDARRRLKWPIRLGETLTLFGVLIAGLSLWENHSERARQRAAQDQAERQAQAQTVLTLRGEGSGGRLKLEPARDDQVIQSQAFYFPSAVRSGVVQISGQGHVDVDWFGSGLKQALKGAADDGSEHSMPVAIVTTYVEGGDSRTDTALYRLGFTIHRRLLQPAVVALEGAALSSRGLKTDPRRAVDAAWSSQASSSR